MSDSKGIKAGFVNGVFWGVIEKFSTLFVGFFITILLARKLTPADYGLVNMLYIFTVLANVILDGGFGQALIQKKEVSNRDFSTIFYFNILFSIIVYGVLYLSSPYIAEFYRQPQLTKIARVSFLMIPINAFCLVQHTILTKYMQVKKLTIVSVTSSLISGIVGVYLAYINWGVWALVYQSLMLQITRSIILWKVGKWHPNLVFDFACIRSIWKFSINMLGVCSLAAIFQNIYTVIIGRFYNVNEVGYYNQAQRLETIASTSITSSIQRVSFPAFAELQNDSERLKKAYMKIMNLTVYIHLPIMIGVIMISHDLFLILLTDKWLPSVPYFCLLCLASTLYPLHMINVNVLKGLGLGSKYLKLETFKRGLMILFIILTVKLGMLYLLIGYGCATLISSLVNMYYCGKVIRYSLIEQVKDLLPALACTIIMALSIWVVNLFDLPLLVRFTTDIIVAVFIYIIFSWLFKIDSFYELKKILLKR